MQVTKGTWRMHEQCVPGSLSSSPAREPGNEASEGGESWHETSMYLSQPSSISAGFPKEIKY